LKRSKERKLFCPQKNVSNKLFFPEVLFIYNQRILQQSFMTHINHNTRPNHNYFPPCTFPVTAFTIERYFAICHPFLSHTMSKLSRAVKYIFLIWILSITFAVPQAIQTGVIEVGGAQWCTVVEERVLIEHSFELATLLFFFAPMSLITVLYILIGVKLRSSTMIKRENGSTVQRNNNLTSNNHQNASQSTKRVLKMLGKRYT
jgi:hypothetical protein